MPRFCGGPVHTVKREYMKKVSALVAALVVALAAASFFATPYHGKVVTNPDWHEPYRNDTALVFLDKPVKNIKPAAIAPRGYLDALKANGTIDDYAYLNVGYGSAEQLVVPQVVSTGDNPCYATSVNERVDTANAHDFLDPYLALK
jgi:hypothetical protein